MVKLILLCAALTAVAIINLAAEAPDLTASIALYKQKDYVNAELGFSQLAGQYPEDPNIAYYLGRIARHQKHYDQAVSYLEKATRLAPTNAAYFVALGDAYGAIANVNHSFTAARQTCTALEHAVELAPTSEEARAALITFCRSAPSIVGGGMVKAYDQAKELRTLDAPAGTRLLATLYEGERRYDEAIAACEETLRDQANNYGLLYVTGRIAAASGTHLDEGIAALEKCLTLPAVEEFPGYAFAHVRLGQLYAKKSAMADARRHFDAALQLDPTNKDASTGLENLPKS